MNIGVIRILGVDPGLRNTGWGLIEAAGSQTDLHRLRLDPHRRCDLARRKAGVDSSLAGGAGRAGRPARGGGRGDFRQPRSAIDAETRPGPRRHAGVARAAGSAGLRIRRQSRQEDGGRRRARRKEPGGDDGQDAAARLERLDSRRRGRARGRHLPRAASRARARGERHDRQTQRRRRQPGRRRPHTRRQRGRLSRRRFGADPAGAAARRPARPNS